MWNYSSNKIFVLVLLCGCSVSARMLPQRLRLDPDDSMHVAELDMKAEDGDIEPEGVLPEMHMEPGMRIERKNMFKNKENGAENRMSNDEDEQEEVQEDEADESKVHEENSAKEEDEEEEDEIEVAIGEEGEGAIDEEPEHAQGLWKRVRTTAKKGEAKLAHAAEAAVDTLEDLMESMTRSNRNHDEEREGEGEGEGEGEELDATAEDPETSAMAGAWARGAEEAVEEAAAEWGDARTEDERADGEGQVDQAERAAEDEPVDNEAAEGEEAVEEAAEAAMEEEELEAAAATWGELQTNEAQHKEKDGGEQTEADAFVKEAAEVEEAAEEAAETVRENVEDVGDENQETQEENSTDQLEELSDVNVQE